MKASLQHETDEKHKINEDSKENIEPALSSIDKACQNEIEIETSDRQCSRISGGNSSFSYDDVISKDVTLCPDCKKYQNVKISELPRVKYPSVYFPLEKFYLCSMCKTWCPKKNKQDDMLSKQVVSDIQFRVNEFVIGIENIEDVLFSKELYQDLSCYVDYKFFETNVPGYGKIK